jgi:Lon protease-like protein
MIADALAGPRVIGMVLLRPGWEQDYHGRPAVYAQGCAGRIEQHEALPEGRSNIVLRGLTRFRILEEHAGEPYRMAAVVPLADAAGGRIGRSRRRAATSWPPSAARRMDRTSSSSSPTCPRTCS